MDARLRAVPTTPAAVLKDGLVGLGLFLALGGEPWRLLPSDVCHPGACQSVSLSAPGKQYATPAQREWLRAQGFRRDGCHTCGACGTRCCKAFFRLCRGTHPRRHPERPRYAGRLRVRLRAQRPRLQVARRA